MTVCVLCEKGSAAKNFAKALNARPEGGAYRGTLDGEEFVVVHARGHLYELPGRPWEMCAPDKVDFYRAYGAKGLPWDPNDLTWQKHRKDKVGSVIDDIEDAFKESDEVVIATDNDPSGEGDLLGWEVLDHLRSTPRKVSRARFEDESAPSVLKALRERRPCRSAETEPMYRRGLYREKWDYLSIQFSRAAAEVTGLNLRQGRLKSAIVVLVGDQEKARADYVKRPFFEVWYEDDKGVAYSRKDGPRHDKKGEAEEEASRYSASEVVRDRPERRRQAPPKLIDLSHLAAQLSKQGMGPEAVKKVYQSMYEDQYVSYPRTEDRKVTSEQFKELLPLTDRICEVVGVDPRLVCHREERKGFIAQGMAHGANRPGPKVPESLEWLDSRYGKGAGAIYKELALRWLAMLSPDREYIRHHGHIKDHPEFTGSVDVTLDEGWRAVVADPSKRGDNEPPEGKGLGHVAEPVVHEGCNKKPEQPTLEWLADKLEKRGIGTGATRNEAVIDLCKERKSTPALMARKRSALSLTEHGVTSWKVLPGTSIGDLELTKRVEEEMSAVADGADEAPYLAKVASMVTSDLARMRENALANGVDRAERGPKKGVWKGKEARIWPEWSGHKWTDAEVEALLAGDCVTVRDAKSKDGRAYVAVAQMAEGEDGRPRVKRAPDFRRVMGPGMEGVVRRAWAGHVFDEREVEALFSGEVIEVALKARDGRPYTCQVGLMEDPAEPGVWKVARADQRRGTWHGKDVRIGVSWSGHEWTGEELDALFSGRTVERDDFVSKKGETYHATVCLLEEDGRVKVGFVPGADDRKRETVKGQWEGKTVEVPKRQWGEDLTDDEARRLFEGERVELSRTSNKGRPYKKMVRLGIGESGRPEVLDANWIVRPYKKGQARIPVVQFGHEVTNAEVEELLRGKSVRFCGKAKSGKDMDADMRLAEDEDRPGTYRLAFVSNKRKR